MSHRVVKAACLIVALKLALFALIAWRTPAAFAWPDTIMYTRAAEALLESGTFQRNGQLEIFRVPGYPIFLVPAVAVAGADAAWLMVPVQVGLGLFCAWLARRLALGLRAAPAAADAAFLIVLLDPAVWLSEFALLSEIVFMVSVTAGVALLCGTRDAVWRPLAGVFVLTLGTFVRPVGLYLPFVLAPVLLFGLGAGKRRYQAGIVVGVLLHLACTQAWQLRNAEAYGVRVFSTVSAAYAYHYFGAAVMARAEGGTYREYQHRFERDVISDNPARQAQHNMRRAMAILASHPLDSAVVAARGLVTTMVDPGTYVLANMLGLRQSNSGIIYRFQELSLPAFVAYLARHEAAFLLLTAAGGLWVLGFWLLVARGAVSRARALTGGDVVLVLACAYLLVTAAGPGAHARFRVPVIPLLAVYAGVGASAVRFRGKERSASVD